MRDPKLIVIDDEPGLASFVCEVAEQAGFQATAFHHAEDFRQNYQGDADVIVLDLLMPEIDGVEVIRYLAQIHCEARLILVSGFDTGVLHSARKLAVEHRLNFLSALTKPFRHDELYRLLDGLTHGTRSEVMLESDESRFHEEELRSALRNDELVLHYQPKIDLSSNHIVGVEALVRWQHPVYGLLFPDRFIALAEQHGLIDDLTWVVIKQVARQLREWKRAGIILSVAVNTSASLYHELSLPDRVSALIREFDVDPHQLVLEVTETALMQEMVSSLEILTRLRMKGVRLSIDDFGTGYSSLVQLHRMPFSELKIDRSFVMEMITDKDAFVIVEAVVALGQKLGMQVVAEGVESQAHIELLTAMDCDLAQGYHISRPQPAAVITDWLMERSERIAS